MCCLRPHEVSRGCAASSCSCPLVGNKGHRAEHVTHVGLRDASDQEVWEYALDHSAVLITKDEDFPSRVWADQKSPGLVWVTIDNCSNRALIEAFEQTLPSIERILNREKALIQIAKTS
jgi:predicted nuclease of predicted toxin-antitoxin system